jgi:hypothetical protein
MAVDHVEPRSHERLTKKHLRTLVRIAQEDLESFFERKPQLKDYRSRLRPGIGRTRSTRPRRAQRRDPTHKQTQRRPPRVRTPARVPRQDQMAHRIRRPNQPSQAKLLLEPHRTHRHHGRPNLVRTRRLRPQPGQDQRPRSMKTKDSGTSRPAPQARGLRRTLFQVEVAS